jgi:hypothetical protein
MKIFYNSDEKKDDKHVTLEVQDGTLGTTTKTNSGGK